MNGKSGFFKRHTLLLSLCMALPCLLLCLLTMRTILDVRASARGAVERILDQQAERLMEIAAEAESLTAQIVNMTVIKKLIHMQGDTVDYTRVTYFDIQTLSEYLTLQCASGGVFSEIALLFAEKDIAVTTRGRNRISWFFEDEFRSEALSESLAALARSESRWVYLPSVLTYGAERRGAAFVHCFAASASGTKPLYLVAFIDQARFHDDLEDMLALTGGYAALTDAAGHALFERGFGGGAAENLSAPLKRFGWSLRLAVPKAELYAGSIRLGILLTTLLALLLGICVLLLFQFVRRHWKPLYRIALSLGMSGENNYQNIDKVLEDLLSHRQKYREILETHHALLPQLRENCLRRYLEQEPPSSELAMLAETLEIRLPYPLACAGILSGTDQQASASWAHLRRAAREMGLQAYDFSYEQRRAFIVSLADRGQREALADVLEDMLTEQNMPSGSVSLGTAYPVEKKLAQSYQEALQAAEYRMLFADAHVILHEMLPSRHEDSGALKTEDEQRLLNFLRVGDGKQASGLLRDVVVHRLHMGASRETLRALLFAASALADTVAREIGFVFPGESPDPFACPTTEALLACVSARYSLLSAQAQRDMERRPNPLDEQIRRVIEDRLTDSSLSLSSVAEALDVSSNYLSRYFKKAFQNNFVHHVSQRRIDLAKRLLREQPILDISQVALQTGFDNDVSFRRSFKKYEGITPSQYRLMGKPESPAACDGEKQSEMHKNVR